MNTQNVLLVGGGLANGLIALALRRARPELEITILERGDRLGGNHTWCFHPPDLGEARAFVEPLIVHHWPRCEVRFPAYARVLEQAYAAVTSDRLHHVVSACGARIVTGADVVALEPGRVRTASGDLHKAALVIDARGPATTAEGSGWQKFVGLEVATRAPHGLAHPVIMDATVEQRDGYRFVYLLPLGADRVLVEDTCFADGPQLDRAGLRAGALAYLAERGIAVAEILREEEGSLPMPWSTPATTGSPAVPGVVRAGYAGGWFHPATGYSFPVAARVAEVIARTALADVPAALAALRARHEDQARFARFLNRMLFRLYAGAARRNVLERFYRLPDDTIQRFYALELGRSDRLRLLCGRPPRGMSVRRQPEVTS